MTTTGTTGQENQAPLRRRLVRLKSSAHAWKSKIHKADVQLKDWTVLKPQLDHHDAKLKGLQKELMEVSVLPSLAKLEKKGFKETLRWGHMLDRRVLFLRARIKLVTFWLRIRTAFWTLSAIGTLVLIVYVILRWLKIHN